jgi:hypothetical protein
VLVHSPRKIFVSPSVTFVLADEAAVLTQFLVAAAGDHMQRDTAASEHVQRRELPSGEGRGGEAGPVRDQQAEAAGHRGRMPGHEDALRRRRVKRHQRPVEPAFLMNAGSLLDMRGIQHWPLCRDDLRLQPRANIADEFNTHDPAFGKMVARPWCAQAK